MTQRHGFAASLCLAFILMAYDIGNLDAIRQGTEGFYLQISKEMMAADSFLTPLYRGEPHWSKPPLHFWLPFPLYYIGAVDTTTAARLTILLFSILSIGLISTWVERFFSIPRVTAALFFLGTVGFAKYSRIYMMEMPLSLLSTLGALYLCAAIIEDKYRDWILACLFSAAAVLVKGPVAWVMIGGGLLGFLILRFRLSQSPPYKKLITWSLATLLLGSLWFVACYMKYGQYFIEYFFLRENLGKFTSKSYPMRVVLQGLLIFSLPWSLFLPVLFSKKSWRARLSFADPIFWPRAFVLINFFVFFTLWLIPNQRSHHYSMPSMFFFLILLLDALKCHHRRLRGTLALIPRWLSATMFFALLPALFLSFAFPLLFESTTHILIMGTAIAFTLFAFIAFFKQLSLKTRALSALLCLGFLWSFVTPLFVLPTLPDRVLKTIGERDLAVVYRKPYFIEEALERPAQVIIYQSEIGSRLSEVEDLLFIPERVVNEQKLKDRIVVLERWRVWQKSRRVKHITKAIFDQDLSQLQEWMLLVKAKP